MGSEAILGTSACKISNRRRRVVKKSTIFVKRLVAGMLCNSVLGRCLAVWYQNWIPFNGLSIYTGCKAVAAGTKAAVFWGIYEGAEIRMIRRNLLADVPVVELGGGIGVVSAFIRKSLRPSCPFVCVEANPGLITSIEANIRRNNGPCAATVVNAAVDYSSGDSSGVIFRIDHNFLLSRLAGDEIVEKRLSVPRMKLKDIFDKYIPGPVQLVMDIEGAEFDVIMKDRASLERCAQIIAEFHDTVRDGVVTSAEDLCGIVCRECSFRLVDRHGAVFVLRKPA